MGTTFGQPMSDVLSEAGFWNALGSREGDGVVGLGQPMTWEYNNGVTAVYDENGAPWIATERTMLHPLSTSRLRKGAFVPHSNDGGNFVRKVLPRLLGRGY